MQISSNPFIKLIRQAPLVFLVLLALFPPYFMIITAFKSTKEYTSNKFGFPVSVTFENFNRVFGEGTFLVWFKNSMILTVGSVFISLVLATLAAFAIAKFVFPGRELINKMMISLMVMPPVVMVIPLFKMMAKVGLINSYSGVIVLYTGMILPFSIYLLTNFFHAVSNEILESAQMDGCNLLQLLVKIILPMSLPAFATLLIVNSLWVWNEILISVIFLQEDTMKTLMVGLTVFKSKYTLDIPVTMAGLIISTLPIALLYLFGQKSFIEGLTAGATKG